MPKQSKPLIKKNGEVRKLEAGDSVRVSMLRDDFPELAAWSRAQQQNRGRPKKTNAKVNATLRLDPDVLAAFKKSGAGWQTRINDLLRAHMPE